MMVALGELLLVLGLLVSAHCEVRARDPEVEEEEEGEEGGRAGESHPADAQTPPLGDRGNHLARTGNWCPFVQQRVVTLAVACGTEKFTIKSQSPCPRGAADCQLVMYKLSTRPIYKQKQQLVTALLWRCCPGHGGDNCEDTVSDAQLEPGSSSLIGRPEAARTEPHAAGLQLLDTNREQSDHQGAAGPVSTGYHDNKHNTTNPHLDTGHAPHHTSKHGHAHLHPQQQQLLPDEMDAAFLPYPESPAVVPLPHMMVLVMSQLQPVLEGFNRSLEHLARQVGELSRDVAQLRSSHLGAGLQAEPKAGPPDSAELGARLEEAFENIREVRRQLESQRENVENRLHSQHAMLHYNLTSFKTDVDVKLKRHQKTLQVSLQAMNATLTELKLNQGQFTEEDPEPQPREPPLQYDTSALWDSIERLDNMVVNNTVKVNSLLEDADASSSQQQQLILDLKDLEKLINQTARTSQVQFMETGLEVEAAREAVLRRVGELAGNLSHHDSRLQEVEEDLDEFYVGLYKQNASAACDCQALRAAVARLEVGVANVTELANDNRLALEEDAVGGPGQWGGANDWEPAVQALQHSLQQVKEAVASDHTRTRTMDRSLSQLSGSLKLVLDQVSGLQESDSRLEEKMVHLSSYFDSLLQDGIRHSDVLELLLGEEVPEFLEWPVQDQEAHSIPALKEQLREHNLSISSLLGRAPGGREEVPSADQPSSSSHWPPHGSVTRRSSGGGGVGGASPRERQLLLQQPEGRRSPFRGDGGDLWNLERSVEELALKVRLLEEQQEAPRPAGEEAKLRAEVTWLKRGLEDHLRVFKNVFSNADVLAASDATVELDALWQLLRSSQEKKKKGGGGRGGHQRSRRGLARSGQSDASLLQAPPPLGLVLLKSHSDLDRFSFVAPVDGVYLFVLTLHLRPGPAHVVLRRRSALAPVSLHHQEVGPEAGAVTGVGLLPLSEGEQVRLDLEGGAWAESGDNTLAVLLLHPTT